MKENKMKFERDKLYIAKKNFVVYVNPKNRMTGVCYEVSKGTVFRFRGKNIGKAEFISKEGKILFLKPRTAFGIFEKMS